MQLGSCKLTFPATQEGILTLYSLAQNDSALGRYKARRATRVSLPSIGFCDDKFNQPKSLGGIVNNKGFDEPNTSSKNQKITEKINMFYIDVYLRRLVLVGMKSSCGLVVVIAVFLSIWNPITCNRSVTISYRSHSGYTL
jgi:hypothetical protein